MHLFVAHACSIFSFVLSQQQHGQQIATIGVFRPALFDDAINRGVEELSHLAQPAVTGQEQFQDEIRQGQTGASGILQKIANRLADGEGFGLDIGIKQGFTGNAEGEVHHGLCHV